MFKRGETLLENWTPDEEIHAYALAVHGLNTRPSAMQPVIDELVAAGIHVTLVILSGHDEPRAGETLGAQQARRHAFRTATRERWHADVIEGYRALEQTAQHDKPRFLVGYSLGGLLGLELIQQGTLQFHRMFLLAPALAMHRRNWILRWLPLPRNTLLPSVMPRRLRVHHWTPLSAYLELFRCVDAFQAAVSNDVLKIPTRIWIDPRDELVSASGTEAWVCQLQSNNWKLGHLPIGRANLLGGCFHHLIIDPSCTGESAWSRLAGSIHVDLLHNEE